MFALVEQWQESGQTQKAFAKAHNISRPCFSYWRTKYEESQSLATTSSGFIAVTPDELASKEVAIEMVFPNGIRVIFHQVNVALVRSLLV